MEFWWTAFVALGLLSFSEVFATDTTKSSCLPGCARDYVPLIKQQCARGIGLSLADNSTSPFPDGNQCWDCEWTRMYYFYMAQLTGRSRRQALNFTAFPDRKWSLPVQFFFNDSIPSPNDLGADAKEIIRNASSHIAAQTCIRFRELSQPATTSYMSFGLGSSCVAFVGRTHDTISSPIFATTNCFSQFGDMLYMMVQSLGMWHETQRWDSGNHVEIKPENIAPGYEGDFGELDQSLNLLVTYGLPYDYGSIMHFHGKTHTRNGEPTIVALDPLYQQTMGQRVQLSFLDAKMLNFMYCADACSSQPLSGTCKNGGYQDPNNCNKCKCPDGFSGTFCTELEPARGAVCGGTFTAQTSVQRIASPGYFTTRYYDPQVKCTWRIQAAAGRLINLTFEGEFGVHCDTNDVCQHWVEVRYTGLMNNTGPRFCCKSLPPSLVTSANEALIIFQSNSSGTDRADRRGFQLAFSLVSVPPPNTGHCNPNPCRNHGRCNVSKDSPTGFICTCPKGLKGPLCEEGCCGGCGAKPGRPQARCVTEEVPQRMCNITKPCYGRRPRRGPPRRPRSWRRAKRHVRWWRWTGKTETIQVPCTFKFCCENAELVGIPNLNQACAVEGWSEWSRCSANCGGGKKRKSLYVFQQHTFAGQSYNFSVAVNTTREDCNTEPCRCESYHHRWWHWASWWCKPCNYGYEKKNGVCVPSERV